MCHALYVPTLLCAMPYVCHDLHGPRCTCATLYTCYPINVPPHDISTIRKKKFKKKKSKNQKINKQPRSRTRLNEDEKGKRVSNSDRWTDLRRDIEYKKLYSIWILLCLKYKIYLNQDQYQLDIPDAKVENTNYFTPTSEFVNLETKNEFGGKK